MTHRWKVRHVATAAAATFSVSVSSVRGLPLRGLLLIATNGAGHVKAGTLGSLVVRLPLPPGGLLSLWQNEPRFHAAYTNRYPGYFETVSVS